LVNFIAETKGSMSSMSITPLEQTKIKCAEKFFEEINHKINKDKVKYKVVNSYEKLISIVNG
jgi:type III restriction enzyme